jgi:predicted dehydrogenase
MSQNAVLRWGILGAARVNERLLPAIMEAKNAKLLAVASRRTGAAAEIINRYAGSDHAVMALDDPEILLAHPEIDAIYLPMANEEHTEWAIKAIRQGKHVLIEKPMALSVSDIEQIESEAKTHNVFVMEGFMYVFHPQHRYVQDIIDAGHIGDVRTVTTRFSFPMKPARLYRIERPIQQGGGSMWDIGPYAIHTARKWFQENPKNIVSFAKLNDHGADTSFAGVIDFGDGRYANFDMSFERARRSEYEIIGTLGGIKCDTVWQNPDDEPVITWWTDAGEQHEVGLDVANHFVLEIEHFSECVLTNTSPYLSMEDAKWNCKTIEAAIHSAMQGQRVAILE